MESFKRALGYFTACLAFVLLAVFVSRWIEGTPPGNSIVAPVTNSTTSSIDIDVSTSTINPEQTQTTSTEMTDWQIFNQYRQLAIYPGGIETPSDYVLHASKALSNAGRKIVVTGTIEDAYLYIRAGANDRRGNFGPIDPQYDGIWFYRKDGQFNGGVLDLSQSRRGETTRYTELLYNLKDVPLALNNQAYRKNNFTSIDILSQLKASDYLASLVSTARYGRIMDFVIGYKCASVTPYCKITLASK
ncbi:hypothetical protein WDW86_22070 [Bdellovibrionota bacterium FG-2]